MGDMRVRSLEWERWVLSTPQKMCGCLVEMVNRGYRGSVTAGVNGDGAPVWALEIGLERPLSSVVANLGQVMILVGTRLEALTKEEYLDVYGDTDAP